MLAKTSMLNIQMIVNILTLEDKKDYNQSRLCLLYTTDSSKHREEACADASGLSKLSK
jgi:hypothetical protein